MIAAEIASETFVFEIGRLSNCIKNSDGRVVPEKTPICSCLISFKDSSVLVGRGKFEGKETFGAVNGRLALIKGINGL